jgi:hypothetical protein
MNFNPIKRIFVFCALCAGVQAGTKNFPENVDEQHKIDKTEKQKTSSTAIYCINTQELATDDMKAAFCENLKSRQRSLGGLYLVIGESLAANHAPQRFSNERWVFLDPDPYNGILTDSDNATGPENMGQRLKRLKRFGIKGFVGDLTKFSSMTEMFSYIVDDIDLLTMPTNATPSTAKYSDFAQDRVSTFDKLCILHNCLQAKGIIVTNAKALKNISTHIFFPAIMKWQFNGRVASNSRRVCTVLPWGIHRLNRLSSRI